MKRPSPNDVWTAERIRKLRGSATRADLAARLGVAPLTVYRWELPDGAAEARRPRGKIREKLDALERELRAPEPATPPSDAELVELLPLLERLEKGELSAAEDAIVLALASGRLRSVASRALAAQALARVQLWARGDARAALTALVPWLDALDALPADVACEVHLTAALVFASLDGRIFDAGKASAHAARALALASPARVGVARLLAWHAQTSVAYTLGDPALLELVLARAADIDAELESPLLRCLAEEVRASTAMFAGRSQHAAEHAERAVRLAREHGLSYALVRMLSQAAQRRADDAVDPDAIEALVARIESIERDARIAPGWHSMFVAYASSEACVRASRLERAEHATREHLRFASELRWSPGSAPLLLARLLLLQGRGSELRGQIDRLAAAPVVVFAEVSGLVADAARVVADLVEGADPAACADRFAALARAIEERGAWGYLARNVALANAMINALAGEPVQAARAIHRAQQVLDRVPSPWGSAVLDGLRGVVAIREGRPTLARAPLERAIGALDRARDRTHAALARHVLAEHVLAGVEPDAERTLARSRQELLTLGIVPLPIRAAQRVSDWPAERAAPAEAPAGPLARALGAHRRVAARGLSPPEIQRELLAALAERFPGAALRLDELDSRGEAVSIAAIGEAGPSPLAYAELGDGSGRRLRVGASIDAAEARAELEALAAVAGLALEVAALRGLAGPAGAPSGPDDAPEIPGLVAASPAMRRLKADVARLGRSRSTVIVTGESGVGKEVVARAIHDRSARAGKPYVAFNCAAVPRDLFEGHLFGYRKGAFTGAVSDHAGVIRAAEGGTLFLDEIGELPLEVQPKLLRFFENAEVFPLGERKPVRVDVRVIAASFRDLGEMVRAGRFREDLYYRLQVVPIHVPPLRERPEDVAALARHFLRALVPEGSEPPPLAPDALAALLAHPWPGNARELRNVLERALAFDPPPAILGAADLRLGRG